MGNRWGRKRSRVVDGWLKTHFPVSGRRFAVEMAPRDVTGNVSFDRVLRVLIDVILSV